MSTIAWIAFLGQAVIAWPNKAQNEQMFSELLLKADLGPRV